MTDSETIEHEADRDKECQERCKCCCCCCYETFWDALEEENPECYIKLMCIRCLCSRCFRTIKKRKQRQAKVDPAKESEKSDKDQVVEPTETPSDVIKDQPKPSQCNVVIDEISEVNPDPVTEKESTKNKKQRGQNRRT